MKKNLIGSLLLVTLFAFTLAAAQAQADTCVCVGISKGSSCGNGGLGAGFKDVFTVAPNNVIKYFIKNTTQQAEYLSGKVFDSKIGWLCFNPGSVQSF